MKPINYSCVVPANDLAPRRLCINHKGRLKIPKLKLALISILVAAYCICVSGQGTGFTYQGLLNNNGVPSSGSYDLTFKLFNAPTAGSQGGITLTNSATTVSNGLFIAVLDFGNGVFSGTSYWLEIAVRTNGNGAFTTLSPRQAITPSPYAIYSPTAGAATTAGTAGSALSATTAANFSGALSGDVTGAQSNTLVSTVGGQSAANLASGASLANASTSANSPNAIVRRDASGNFSVGAVTATSVIGNGSGLTSLNAGSLSSGTVGDARLSTNVPLLTGNNAFSGSNNFTGVTVATNASNVMAGAFTGNLNGSASNATNFSGPLSGEVTGTQSATVVGAVGGQSSASIANGVQAANNATSANATGTIVKRDASGNFAAGTITAALAGNASTATTATNFSGSLLGDVTGTQGATVVAGVGGQTAASVASGVSAANAATSANTAFTIVKRDASGNFSAGAVSAASVSGDGSGLTNLNGANLMTASVGAAKLSPGAALTNLQQSGELGVAAGGIILSSQPNATNLLAAGYVAAGSIALGEQWNQASATNPPAARGLTRAIWTGREMILWGGYNGSGGVGTGGRFDPAANTWTLLPASNAPSPRHYHAAIWTGTEMIIWGGYDDSLNVTFNTGARYNPGTDTWTPTSTNGAPVARHSIFDAVWTGAEMLVWGGYNGTSPENTGARYNPTNDTWTPITTNGAPDAREAHSSVWTGTNMIVWGGYGASSPLNTGARYNPATDTWTPISTNNAPIARYVHATVWTGKEMIVWGGRTEFSGPPSDTDTGGRYDPALDAWSPVTSSNAPSARFAYPLQAVWTGKEMIIWSGADFTSPGSTPSTGARYDTATDSWKVMTSSGAPAPRFNVGLVWTGSSVIVSGGGSYAGNYTDTFLYSPPLTLYLYAKP
jgi:hypothetical protein